MHHHVLIGADVIEQEGEAGLCIAHNAFSPAECRERGGALVAVQVDDEIVFPFPQAARKAQDAEEAPVTPLLVDQQTFIDVCIFLHDVRENPIRKECNACGGIIMPQRAQDGRHKHEIAEMHEVDNENIPIFAHCPSNESPCSISCHESVRRMDIRACRSSWAAEASPAVPPGSCSVRVPSTVPMRFAVRK